MKFKDYVSKNLIFLRENLILYLNKLDCPNTLKVGMEYSLLGGGKYLRPLLLFMILEFLNKKKDHGLPSAIALEFIHAFSLVHDDLPALDNDDYRRGKLTTHKKFGEAEAILIGDSLLTSAFYCLSRENRGIISDSKIVDIIAKTSEYTGPNGMIGGQMLDIESEGKQISLETLKIIHRNKTGKLIKLPIELACIIADATLEQTSLLKKYGELIGLAFQIKDDILDIEGDFESLGKNIGSDLSLNKATYPSIMGIDESKNLLNEIIEKAQNIISENFKKNNTDILLGLTNYIKNREN